ncbi:MAG TPA: hypothetical protein VNA14_00075 [Mycobacteriales bacterium]|nr:hypothetical protein [Mycobacteriales bacterium]
MVPPLYPRLLRLKHLHPSAWQRAVLVEGAVAVGSVAALSDQVSAWTPLVLPVAVAVVVKFHDVLTGILRGPGATHVADVAAVDAPAVALPHVVVRRSGRSAQPERPEPATADLDIDVEFDVYGDDYSDVSEVEAVDVPAAVAVPISPIAASGLRVRADLDALAAAALEQALDELTRRGGLDAFVLRLDDDGIDRVDPDDVVSLPGRPGLRAVVICSDVGLPGRADAVRMELEHAHGEPELVTVVYRHTGEGPEVVPCERTRTSGKRSGVRRRFFAKQA